MVNLLVGLGILVGLIGVAVPLMPGLLLIWTSVAVWAIVENRPLGWTVLAVATLLVAVSQVVKYVVPGQRLRQAGVPTSTLLAGTVTAIVGFFVIPVVGLALGFVAGVYAAQWWRTNRGRHRSASRPPPLTGPPGFRPEEWESQVRWGPGVQVGFGRAGGAHAEAWATTILALKAVGLSILIELGAGMLIAATWVVGLLLG